MLETTVLTDKAGVALDLIGDVAQRASFDAAGVKRARERITSILQTKEGSPIFLADRAFQHLLFGNTGHGTAYPSRSTIDSISISDLQDSYIRQFRPDRAVLVVAGDFDEGTVRSKIQDSFGHWNKRGSTTGDPLVRTRVLHQDRNTVWYIPRPGSVQTTLLLAAVAPTEGDPEYVQAALANLVLGGMDFGSRLVANLREDKGYGYHPSSTLLPFGDTGIFVLLADVKNGVTGAAFNEILYELNRLSTTTASEDEMQRARRYFAGWQTITLQTRSRLAWTLAQYWAHGLHPEYLSAQQHKAAAVTAVDVQNAARNLFIPSKLTFLAVGDEDVILRELAPFGWELKRLQ